MFTRTPSVLRANQRVILILIDPHDPDTVVQQNSVPNVSERSK